MKGIHRRVRAKQIWVALVRQPQRYLGVGTIAQALAFCGAAGAGLRPLAAAASRLIPRHNSRRRTVFFHPRTIRWTDNVAGAFERGALAAVVAAAKLASFFPDAIFALSASLSIHFRRAQRCPGGTGNLGGGKSRAFRLGGKNHDLNNPRMLFARSASVSLREILNTSMAAVSAILVGLIARGGSAEMAFRANGELARLAEIARPCWRGQPCFSGAP